ncbi:MAG: hypothetical protein RL518_416 [Pseudomonadota bacterium]|jgi:hypothetical protein
MSCFHLDNHEGLANACDQVGLQTAVSPVACENYHAVTLKEALCDSLTPSAAGEVPQDPTAS